MEKARGKARDHHLLRMGLTEASWYELAWSTHFLPGWTQTDLSAVLQQGLCAQSPGDQTAKWGESV